MRASPADCSPPTGLPLELLQVSLPHQAPPCGWGEGGKAPGAPAREGRWFETIEARRTANGRHRPVERGANRPARHPSTTVGRADGEAAGAFSRRISGWPGALALSGIRHAGHVFYTEATATEHTQSARTRAAWGSGLGAAPASGPLRPPRPRAAMRHEVSRFTLRLTTAAPDSENGNPTTTRSTPHAPGPPNHPSAAGACSKAPSPEAEPLRREPEDGKGRGE